MRSISLRHLISVMVPALVLGGLAYLIIPVLSIVILISVPLLMHSKRKGDQEKLKHANVVQWPTDRKSTRLNSSHVSESRMPSSA